jgi:hypothetical protein
MLVERGVVEGRVLFAKGKLDGDESGFQDGEGESFRAVL